jgi:hypothetical protein
MNYLHKFKLSKKIALVTSGAGEIGNEIICFFHY